MSKNRRKKEIKLTHMFQIDPYSVYLKARLYNLSLGNGKVYSGTCKRKINTHLVYWSNILNKETITLYHTYTDVCCEIQKRWLVLTDKEYKALINRAERLQDTFRQIYSKQNFTNYNYYVFSWIKYIINELKAIIRELIRILQKAKKLDNCLNHQAWIFTLNKIKSELELK
jgi:hypothetical protein